MQTIGKVRPDVVLISQLKGHSIEHFEALYAKLKSAGVGKVIFAGPVPHWEQHLPKIILRKFWEQTPRRTFTGIDRGVYDNNNDLKAHFPALHAMVFADLTSSFCTAQGCLVYLGEDRNTGLTSWDYSHLTPSASNFLAKNLLVKLIVAETVTDQSAP